MNDPSDRYELLPMNKTSELISFLSLMFTLSSSCHPSVKAGQDSVAAPSEQPAVTPVQETETLVEFHPGDLVPEDFLSQAVADTFFRCIAIPDSIFELMQGKTFKADCTVSRDDLRYLLCLHRDKDGQTFVGEMVVATRIADDVLDILHRLYDASYPIERMRLPDYWDADDERLMTANNSSSFNFRFVSHTQIVSKHGLGIAVDINPLYNPYHKTLRDGTEVIEPAIGKPYLDRSKDFDYKITKGDLCYRLFKEKGFSWGGDWPDRKDYQHFELRK